MLRSDAVDRFGCFLRGKRTGIIFNSCLKTFKSYLETPWSQTDNFPNRLEPGKRPLSSRTPAFLIDAKGEVVMTIGASGGAMIISAVSYVTRVSSQIEHKYL